MVSCGYTDFVFAQKRSVNPAGKGQWSSGEYRN
jgi:hypothetical protein